MFGTAGTDFASPLNIVLVLLIVVGFFVFMAMKKRR